MGILGDEGFQRLRIARAQSLNESLLIQPTVLHHASPCGISPGAPGAIAQRQPVGVVPAGVSRCASDLVQHLPQRTLPTAEKRVMCPSHAPLESAAIRIYVICSKKLTPGSDV